MCSLLCIHLFSVVSIICLKTMNKKVIATVAAISAYAFYKYTFIKCTKTIEKPWKKRRWWMKEIHENRTREFLELKLHELKNEDGELKNFTRMSREDFEYLLNLVSPLISKKDTKFRPAIPPEIRLAVTLRYLATGDSFKSLHYCFKISSELISHIVGEVCEALNEVLKNQIKMPESAEEWIEIEKGFRKNFPHALGAVDGKHVVIECPAKSGSEYYNYKRTFSIVLMAVVDSGYRFIYADIGSQGRISDGGVFRNCSFGKALNEDTLNLPTPQPLPGSNVDLPYFFGGDGAFALHKNLMKPYPGDHPLNSPQRIFNETLSRSRVLVENTFGILSSRFRCFKKAFLLDPKKVATLTMTCVLLHNFLMKSSTSQNIYNPAGTTDRYGDDGIVIPGSWRTEDGSGSAIREMRSIARRPPTNANLIREQFANYFVSLK